MMKIDEKTRRAIDRCIDINLPFALILLPGDDSPLFFASVPDTDDDYRNVWESKNPDWRGFIINFFANDEEYTAGIRAELSADGVLKIADSLEGMLPPTWTPLQKRQTEKFKYISVVNGVIERLKRDGGKTVLSRIETVESDRDINDVAEEYFNLFSKTFRYLCFTQETGLWLGATPEILARISDDSIETMALAGTMKARSRRQWDQKNLDEHNLVVGFILTCLSASGAQIDKDIKTTELKFGSIKHLCTPIRAKLDLNGKDRREFLTRLSPTPAVGGFPREKALPEIFVSETHERLCYGGFVGLITPGASMVYVNLRCAMAARTEKGYTYNIYSGGGITAESIAADEWDEAVSKVRPLNEIIKGKVSDNQAANNS